MTGAASPSPATPPVAGRYPRDPYAQAATSDPEGRPRLPARSRHDKLLRVRRGGEGRVEVTCQPRRLRPWAAVERRCPTARRPRTRPGAPPSAVRHRRPGVRTGGQVRVRPLRRRCPRPWHGHHRGAGPTRGTRAPPVCPSPGGRLGRRLPPPPRGGPAAPNGLLTPVRNGPRRPSRDPPSTPRSDLRGAQKNPCGKSREGGCGRPSLLSSEPGPPGLSAAETDPGGVRASTGDRS